MVQSLQHTLVYHKDRSSLLFSSIFSFKISITTSLVIKSNLRMTGQFGLWERTPVNYLKLYNKNFKQSLNGQKDKE